MVVYCNMQATGALLYHQLPHTPLPIDTGIASRSIGLRKEARLHFIPIDSTRHHGVPGGSTGITAQGGCADRASLRRTQQQVSASLIGDLYACCCSRHQQLTVW